MVFKKTMDGLCLWNLTGGHDPIGLYITGMFPNLLRFYVSALCHLDSGDGRHLKGKLTFMCESTL